MRKKGSYRIKDIAIMSGVSTGTVDRIIHNRGKVSEEARVKVEEVLKKVDYRPNIVASALASKKTYKFVMLIPAFSKGDYWEIVNQGIERAEEELSGYHIEIERVFFDQYDKDSFDKQMEILEGMEFHGIVIATLFKESVLRFTIRLDKMQIPYVLIDAFIENTHCLAYYGTNSFNSGYIAAKLMYQQIGPDDKLAVFRFIRKGDSCSTQVLKREEGFRTYLDENHFRGTIYPVHIHADDNEGNRNILDSFFLLHGDVKAGIIFNSRVHVLGDYFKARKKKDFKLIGYDILDENVAYLNNGLVTHLIAQRPEVQGVNCVRDLFRHLILKEKVKKMNFMPIDILIKENISYYNNYI